MGGSTQDPESAATAPRGVVRAVLAALGALATIVGFVFTLCACSNDLGALYCDPGQCPSDDAGATPRATPPEGPPWLPALPDEDNVAACEACAKEKCVRARDNCRQDDACTALLECKGRECDDPACLADCEAKHEYSAWYDDLWLCTFGTCGTECGAGENWGCVGKYDWPRAESARFQVQFDFEAPPALGNTLSPPVAVGARARFCPDSDDVSCGLGSRSETVDAMSSVTLEVAANGLGSAATGWVELESTSLGFYGWRDRFYGQPLSRSATVRAYPSTRDMFRIAAGGWLDLESTWISIGIMDCVGWPAIGVHHSLPDHPETNPCHFRLGGGLCNPGAEGFVSALQLDAAAIDGPLRVRVERTDTSQVVAERIVYGRSGWRTQVMLYPRSREQ